MLTLENIVWQLPDGEKILNGVNLTVSGSRMTVVTGPNGGGKPPWPRLSPVWKSPPPAACCWTGRISSAWT